jgi:hypothetical protein
MKEDEETLFQVPRFSALWRGMPRWRRQIERAPASPTAGLDPEILEDLLLAKLPVGDANPLATRRTSA